VGILGKRRQQSFPQRQAGSVRQRRKEIETGIQALEEMIEEIERESITQE